MDSQWTETALPLKTLTLKSGGSSINPYFPCGAMISAKRLVVLVGVGEACDQADRRAFQLFDLFLHRF